jgi:hypothetical protein
MQDIMRFNQKETSQDIWAHYDPEKAIEGIRRSSGALQGVGIGALQRDIRDHRRQDSTGRPA